MRYAPLGAAGLTIVVVLLALLGTSAADAPPDFGEPAAVSSAAEHDLADHEGSGGDRSDGSEQPDEAQQLLDDTFGDELREPAAPLELPPGGEVGEYIGDHAARIELADGASQVAVSALPLRVEDAEGDSAPVDLSLEQDGADLVPANPVVDLSVPQQIADGAVVGDDGLRLAPATGDATASDDLSGNKVFYPEIAKDTDWLVGPVPTGAEFLLQLRSAESPERHSVDVTLPQGAGLNATADGGAEIVRDGDVLARVRPPAATDANGAPVPVAYEVGNDGFDIVVNHRDRDVAYPILIDPVVEDWATDGQGHYVDGWFQNPTLDQLGWEFSANPSGGFQGMRQGNGVVSYGAPPGRGLYVLAPPSTQRQLGDYGYWSWHAPGQTAFITRAEFRTIYFEPRNGPAIPAAVAGLWNSERGAFSGLRVSPWRLTAANSTVEPGDNVLFPSAHDTDTAIFGMAMLGSNHGPSWISAYLGGAVLYLDDPEPATVHVVDAPTGWVGPGGGPTIEGTDPGLGVKTLRLAGGAGGPVDRTHPCLGDRLSRCPASWSQRFDASTLPEGISTLQASATDVLGKRSSTKPVTVKIDRGGPQLTVTGELRQAAGTFLEDRAYALHLVAADGTTAAPRSGVRSLELLVDGQRKELAEQTCLSGNCSMTRDFSVDASTLADGDHQVQVRATDVAGNLSEQHWTVRSDRTAPAVTVSGGLWEARSGWIDGGQKSLHVAATDAGTGVASIGLVVDGIRRELTPAPACPAGGCGLTVDWTLDAAALDSGEHLVQVLVLDRAGRLHQDSWTLHVDHADPLLELSGALADADEGELGADAPLHVHATDAGSGVTEVEISLDGVRAELRQQPCGAAGGCELTVDWTLAVDGLAEGPHTVSVRATDGVGRSRSRELRFDLHTDDTPVAPPLDPTEITPFEQQTDFLYTGAHPVQTGVADGTIVETRAAVIRGKVTLANGEPLDGVTATVVDHPEYGQTVTRGDGEIYLAVNGGGPLTVRLERDGYLPVDRQVDVPWQGYAQLDPVSLIQPDSHVTEVEVGDPLSPVQVHRGTRIDDGAGARQATLVFPRGEEATMELPDGSTQPLWDMHVRATEYTVGAEGPSAMPAPLPPTSAYTYAADFSVDEARAAGAKHVNFSKPVIGYLENFRRAPVGGRVPNGYYERETGQWVPDTDGRVVKVLSESGGVAALDVTGGGQAADAAALAALGIDEDELRTVADLYEPGQELWRVPMRHFSDWNFGFLLIGQILKPADWLVDRLREHFCGTSGSVIECENQTLGEDLSVTGTGIELHYRSDRVPGRSQDRYEVDIPLIDGEVPVGLQSIALKIEVAGRTFTRGAAPAPNQKHHFTWDGKDAFGRTLQGAQKAKIHVGYVYNIQYDTDPVSPEDQTKGFGIPPRGSAWSFFSIFVDPSGGGGTGAAGIAGPPVPPTVTVWRDVDTTLGGIDARAAGLGGWTLSPHHQYDPVAKVLYLGDGSRQSTETVNRTIERYAGRNNEAGQDGDGGKALDAHLNGPGGMDVGPDGSVYVAEFYNDTVRRIWPDGTITRVAGIPRESPTQPWELSGDGGPAIAARLGSPTDVDVGPDGSLTITDYGNQRIRRVDPNGIITTVAGGGDAYNVSDVPATDALLNRPQATEVAPDGTLYIGDRSGRVKRVGPDGRLVIYAGGGTRSQDDIQATERFLFGIDDLALAPDGTLYIAEGSFFTGVIYRVTPEGMIRRVAGDYLNSSDGDDEDGSTVPALTAHVNPHRVAVAPDGSVHIVDRGNRKVWRLDSDGMLRAELGAGAAGDGSDNGDAGPARQAKTSSPMNLTFAPDGAMYLGDYGYETIRRVGDTMSGFTGEDLALPSADGSELYRFDETGRHLETLSTATSAVLERFHYDSAGRLSSIEDGDGNELSIERDGAGKPTALVAPFGQHTELTVDGDGWLTGVSDPAGRDATLAYGDRGLLSSFALPGGRISSFDYDSGGRLLRDENADGGFKTLTRTDARHSFDVTLATKAGRSSQHHVELLEDGSMQRVVTDPAEVETTTHEGDDGTRTVETGDGTRITHRLAPDPRFGMTAGYVGQATVDRPSGAHLGMSNSRQVELANPDDALSVSRIVDSSTVASRTTTSTWDRAAATLTTHYPSDRSTVSTHDGQGRVTLDHAPGVHDVAYDYDTHGRLTGVVQGDRSAGLDYDTDGWLSSITDPLGRETHFTRDVLGRVTAESLPGGRQVSYSYDSAGNLATITPPGRPEHAFAHSLTGLRTAWTSPLVTGAGTGATTFEYDDDQAISAVERPDGSEISVERDDAGRPTAIGHPDGRVELGYDPDGGQPTSVSVPGGQTVSFGYDGSVSTSETASGEVEGEITQTRDGEGRLLTSSLTGAPLVVYAYDTGGLLRAAGDLSLTRDPATGFLSSTSLGDVATGIDYDGFGDLSSLTAHNDTDELFSESVGRDDGGRITSRTETVDGGSERQLAYEYDAAGRLDTVREGGQVQVSYDYDDNGNRVAEHPATGPAVDATFDDQDRLLRRGDVDYAWTPSGDLQSRTDTGTDETTTYAYDALGGLKHVELPNGHEIDYIVDGLDRRVGKKVDGDLQYGFLYGEASRPSAELAPDGSVRTRFVYGTHSTVPDYMERGGHTYRFVTDHLGSPRLVIDAGTGTIVQELDYDAFGQVTEDTNPGFQPFGYAGGLYDPDTHLVRFGARDYDPETGRWTAKDPLDFGAGDTNLYAYVFNDPINLIDPSGEIVDTVIDAAFVSYDVATIALGCGSWSSLALDAAALAIPFVAGLGHASEIARLTRSGGDAGQAAHVLPSSGRTFVTTPRGTTYDIPAGWQGRPAHNKRGIVYQRPGANRNVDSIRIMEPTEDYPGGYFRYYGSTNQALDVNGKPTSAAETHIPEDFEGVLTAWPK